MLQARVYAHDIAIGDWRAMEPRGAGLSPWSGRRGSQSGVIGLDNVEKILNKGIDVVCAGLDQDSRGKPWETSSFLLGLSDKITKIYGFCNVCGLEATKTYRKIEGGSRTQVGAANIYEPRCLKHWKPR